MTASKSMVFFLVVMAVASFELQSAVAQTSHVVGGSLGWTIPQNGAAAYTDWAANQTFTVGDTLVFNFANGQHNVAEVSEAAYGPCNTATTLSIATTSPANLNLGTAGRHYYVCTVGTHCNLGQKLTINVAAATSAATPPASSTPAPGGSTTAPPLPSPGSASSFSAVVPVTFLAAVLALFY